VTGSERRVDGIAAEVQLPASSGDAGVLRGKIVELD
jgi:hypothetical protein